MSEKMFDGLIGFSENEAVPFHFEDTALQLFFGGAVRSVRSGVKQMVGDKHGYLIGGKILFHFSLPFENFNIIVSDEAENPGFENVCGTIRHEVDFYIDKYEPDSFYNEMRFSFPELDYFLPSSSLCENDFENGKLIFSRKPIIIKRFGFMYKGSLVWFTLRSYSAGEIGYKAISETKSEILLQFEGTDDLDYLRGLYEIVYDFFCFVCNRKNIALDSVQLRASGTPAEQYMVILDKYKRPSEDKKAIAKTSHFALFSSAFEKLFCKCVKGEISISSIHDSPTSKNFLDLKHSLQITAAFEYYQRTFLPAIEQSPDTALFYANLGTFLSTYADTHKGKLRQKAKSHLKQLIQPISLGEKICKVYRGYSRWRSLEPILEEWFGSNLESLATAANQWRNALAHEKREYEPNEDVVPAIRLVEHLNYCIVLRESGFTDAQIKRIVNKILTR